MLPESLVSRPLDKGNVDSGNEIGRCHETIHARSFLVVDKRSVETIVVTRQNINDCSRGKHLFCFPRITMFDLDSRETKQMFSEGAVIKCFLI